jgi:hypothetical protein
MRGKQGKRDMEEKREITMRNRDAIILSDIERRVS